MDEHETFSLLIILYAAIFSVIVLYILLITDEPFDVMLVKTEFARFAKRLSLKNELLNGCVIIHKGTHF